MRAPASFCGILGFRPSHGVISSAGVVPMAQSFDTVGELGACKPITDCFLITTCIG